MKSNTTRLILASASARRRRLLSDAGVSFEALSPDVEESDCSISARNTVMNNAVLKNQWAVERYPGCSIIAADTAIEFEGLLIGKPANMDAAREQLRRFSGRTHTVLTGIACSFANESVIKDICESPVTFLSLSDEMITNYFKLVDPLDKAGAYDIGSHGDMIVESHEGSLTNIIGLPMELITPLLTEHGYLS